MEEDKQTEVRRETVRDGSETVQRERVKTTESVSGTMLTQRIIYFVGGTVLVLLALRFLLLMFGASRASGFVDFIYSVSGPFAAPFNGIFREPTYGTAAFDTSTLVAIIVYAIVMVGLANLVTIGSKNRD